jgi:hypothetical protein
MNPGKRGGKMGRFVAAVVLALLLTGQQGLAAGFAV